MSDIDDVNAALAAHVSAVNTGDIEANLAGFSDDQVYMPPGLMPVRGKPELEKMIRTFNEGRQVRITMTPEETVVSGDWAFQWGFLKGDMRDLGSEEYVPMDWKFVYIYKREEGGDWKIARDIYNDNGSTE